MPHLDCRACSLGSGYACAPVVPENPRLVIVGEAPGAEEERTGDPFVGKAGRLLRDLVSDILGDIPVVYTNRVWCRPPENDISRAGEALVVCPRVRLFPLLSSLAPIPVLALGKTASSLWIYRRSMAEMDRKLRATGDHVVICAYHPAAALRGSRQALASLTEALRELRVLIPRFEELHARSAA